MTTVARQYASNANACMRIGFLHDPTEPITSLYCGQYLCFIELFRSHWTWPNTRRKKTLFVTFTLWRTSIKIGFILCSSHRCPFPHASRAERCFLFFKCMFISLIHSMKSRKRSVPHPFSFRIAKWHNWLDAKQMSRRDFELEINSTQTSYEFMRNLNGSARPRSFHLENCRPANLMGTNYLNVYELIPCIFQMNSTEFRNSNIPRLGVCQERIEFKLETDVSRYKIQNSFDFYFLALFSSEAVFTGNTFSKCLQPFSILLSLSRDNNAFRMPIFRHTKETWSHAASVLYSSLSHFCLYLLDRQRHRFNANSLTARMMTLNWIKLNSLRGSGCQH